MAHPLLRSDFHVHSTFSDDAVSTLAENIAAASAIGLETVRLIDHVRQSTTWVPEFVAAVAAERVPDGLTVLTGVEAKMMDVAGGVDIPPGLGDLTIVIADHQFPGEDGPLHPEQVRARIASGELAAADAIAMIFSAYSAAMRAFPTSQLAHPFSIVPKIGLADSTALSEHSEQFVAVAIETDTTVEVNQKWGVSPLLPLSELLAAGRIVAASDSHVATDVGVYGPEVQLPLEKAAGA